MVHGTTSEACSCDGTTLGTLVVIPTTCTHQRILHILILPLPLVLMVPLLTVLLPLLPLTLESEDLVVEVLKFVSPLDCLFEGRRWYNPGGIPLYDGIQSFKELSYLLLNRIHYLRSIS